MNVALGKAQEIEKKDTKTAGFVVLSCLGKMGRFSVPIFIRSNFEQL